MRKVFVLGSINMDYCINTKKMPLIGESKEGSKFLKNQGGKGANQAIACKKLGINDVFLISAVGDDKEGLELKQAIDDYNINTEAFQFKKNINSGACVILFDESINDNAIVVDKAANNYLSFDEVKTFLEKHANPEDIFISQLEVNLDTLYRSLEFAKKLGLYTILNPAPVVKINEEYYQYVDLIVPNEIETMLLTNVKVKDDISAKKAYTYFHQFGIKELVITLGKNGSYYLSDEIIEHHDIVKTNVVDTTSAGDTFIGALAYKKALGCKIKDSMDFAAICSSITVSKKGAGKSIPTIDEVLQTIEERQLTK